MRYFWLFPMLANFPSLIVLIYGYCLDFYPNCLDSHVRQGGYVSYVGSRTAERAYTYLHTTTHTCVRAYLLAYAYTCCTYLYVNCKQHFLLDRLRDSKHCRHLPPALRPFDTNKHTILEESLHRHKLCRKRKQA